jgi:predicted Zn finger-like uncharacterized protein
MIIQCDHCSAKFKMDDSKLANGPVKVRCAKCKEVFVVRKEEPAAEIAAAITPESPQAEPAGLSVPAPASDPSGFEADDAGFSFDQELPPVKESSQVDQSEDSNEFDWQSSAVSFDASQEKAEFDLSAFESSLDSPKETDSAQGEIPDSGDFNFDDTGVQEFPPGAAASETHAQPAPQDDFSLDFGEVSFGDPHSAAPAASDSSIDDNFSLPPEIPPQGPDSSSSDDFVISFNSDTPAQNPGQNVKADDMEGVNFGDFNFGEIEPPAAASSAKLKPAEPDHKDIPESYAAFSEEQYDELPPSSLSSRKKSGSQFPLLVIVGAIVLIISLAGFGVYFFSGPKAFSSVGLGFLVDWYGDKGKEEGSISLKNVTAGYTTNTAAGELFVVRGEAVNNYKKPRASVQVKVTVTGPGGVALVSKSAYSGNSLSAEQLNTLPMAKIEEVMNNQFGDSLANLGLKPGSSIPFVVVVNTVPKDATDYTVLVSGSTVATQ